MDVKFITTTASKLSSVPKADGQVIALSDKPGYYYDMGGQRHKASSTVHLTSLPDTGQTDVLYIVSSETGTGMHIWNGTSFTCVASPNVDTKNTAGSTNSDDKLLLVGAKSQADAAQTYSNDKVYVQGGVLYSNDKQVSTTDHTHNYLPTRGGDITNGDEKITITPSGITGDTNSTLERFDRVSALQIIADGVDVGYTLDEHSDKLNTIESGAQVNTVTGVKGNSESSYRTGNINITAANIGLGNVTNESKATMFTNAALTGTPTAPTAASGTNTTQIASTAFVQAAIDKKIAAADAMIYKGTIGTGGTVTSLPATHSTGWTYKVITAGTYAGVKCEIGDMIVCLTDGTTATDSHWSVIQSNIDGAVTGPSSSVDAHVAVFSGTSGKVVKDSGFTIGASVPSGAKFTDTVYTHPAYTARTSGLYKITVDATGHVSGVTAVTKADITGLGIPSTDSTYSAGDGLLLSGSTFSANLVALSAKGNIPYVEATSNKQVATIAAMAWWDGSWESTNHKSNLSYCNQGAFGKAATYSVTSSVTSGSTALITSGAVYTSLAGKAPTSGSLHYMRVFNSSAVNSASSTVGVNDLAKQHFAVGMVKSATDNPTGAASWVHAMSLGWADGTNASWTSQLAFGTGQGDGIYYRTTQNALEGLAWKRILDSSNYKTYVTPANIGAATSGHTHNYAGSSSAGGSATSAVKLDTATAGSATQPVYFSGGKPVACTYTLGKSVPSNAVFTDTHYTTGLIVGASATATANAAATNGNVYLNVMDTNPNTSEKAIRNAHKISGSGATTVTSDASGNITISSTNTTYSNFVKSGSGAQAGLVPAPSTTAGTTKYLREDGTWQVPPNTNTTYSNMTGATASAAGAAGLVPAPAAGKQTSFLRGDGTWVVPTNTTYSQATSTALGLVKIGYTASGKNYPVQLNSSGQMYVNVPWTDNNTDTNVTQTVTTSNANYPLLLAPNGQTATATTTSYFDSGVTLNPSTNTITANITGSASGASYAHRIHVPTITTVFGTTYTVATYLALIKNTLPLATIGFYAWKHSWSYAGNGLLSATIGGTTHSIQLAGAHCEFIGNEGGEYVLRITTATTSGTTGANFTAGATYEYSTHGDNYSPGWTVNNSIIGLSVSGRTITYTKNNGTTGTITTQDTDTHYTTGIRVGASGTNSNAAATDPYLKVLDNTTYRSQVRLVGGGGTTVSSDANGNITISSTDTNTDTKVTQTNTTGNANYRVLLSANANDTSETNTSLKSSKFLANPYTGAFTATKVYNAVWNDYAEWFEKENVEEEFEPGDIVTWAETGVTKTTKFDDRLVVGVYSDTYGHIVGGEELDDMEENRAKFVSVGLTGRVNVKVKGVVRRGDLIVSSDVPGVGMVNNNPLPGTVIGKALENKDVEDISRVKMLIMLA